MLRYDDSNRDITFQSLYESNDDNDTIIIGGKVFNKLKASANDVFDEIRKKIRLLAMGGLGVKHICILGDPGVGKTHTVKEALDEIFKSNKNKFSKKTYISGAMSPALTFVAAFFYAHKDNEIIIFDDCDDIISKDSRGAVHNFMKGVMDNDGRNISVKFSGTGYNNFKKNVERELEEGIKISIDRSALREGIFRYTINGKSEFCKISEKEARMLSNSIPLKEADEVKTEFTFKSSIIFISNKTLNELDSAVVNRCFCIDVHLTLSEFLDRLKSVLPGLYSRPGEGVPSWITNFVKPHIFDIYKEIIETKADDIYKENLSIRTFELDCDYLAGEVFLYFNDNHIEMDQRYFQNYDSAIFSVFKDTMYTHIFKELTKKPKGEKR